MKDSYETFLFVGFQNYSETYDSEQFISYKDLFNTLNLFRILLFGDKFFFVWNIVVYFIFFYVCLAQPPRRKELS